MRRNRLTTCALLTAVAACAIPAMTACGKAADKQKAETETSQTASRKDTAPADRSWANPAAVPP